MRRSPTASGRAGGRGFWTGERVAELTRHWAEGLVGSAIAERLGTTKDAVVSKAHRLALETRLPEACSEPRPSHWERRLAALAAATGITAEDLLRLQRGYRPQPRGRALFTACQFVVGDLKAGGHRCGAAVARNPDGWPYCGEHLARCRQPRRLEAESGRERAA
ncbi:MAG: GcrA family cell cycle regulator [Tistlia sp.]|uniref:GcrA family cell cycle regulator n=1 Tax=Tistlia sp. TaxID=3057121 RepID=UPI0034A2DA4F